MTLKKSTSPRIGILGAGFSGICAAVQLQKQLGNIGSNFTILDENEDFGGTWLVNKYPGCACDVQSHLYSLSFELNPSWSQSCASASEIWSYMIRVANKYDLYRRARFSTKVQSGEWIEADGQWKVTLYDKKTKTIEVLRFDYMIIAVGGLRAPELPQEFVKFTGKIIHSAQWDPSYDFTNQRVGVIGSGASAIQIIPSLASKVKELHSYQRRPAWVLPRISYNIPTLLQQVFTTFPIFMWFFRILIFTTQELLHSAFNADSALHYLATLLAKLHMRNQIPQDKDLVKKLTPNYKLGCKRLLMSNDFYPAFLLPQVYLHREKIETVKGNRIKIAGKSSQELDVLILATGFQVQDFFSPLQVIAKDSVNLYEKWKSESPRLYFGIMCNACPNAFFLFGPNTGLSHNSILFQIECQVNFLVQVIHVAEEKRVKSVTVKKSAQDECMNSILKDTEKKIWQVDNCASLYRDHRGQTTAMWPKTAIYYWRRTRRINLSHFEFTHLL